MTLDEIFNSAVKPALVWLPPKMTSPKAIVQLLATGLQESRFIHRFQLPRSPALDKGPARSFWQMEKGGAITNVLVNTQSRDTARAACAMQHVAPDPLAVWQAVENDDVLAAIFARLEYWTNPKPLPDLGDSSGAWDYYLKTWRPGAPKPDTWGGFYAQALAHVNGMQAA